MIARTEAEPEAEAEAEAGPAAKAGGARRGAGDGTDGEEEEDDDDEDAEPLSREELLARVMSQRPRGEQPMRMRAVARGGGTDVDAVD